MSYEGLDEVELERRLTKMESNINSGFTGIHQRLDTLNGKVFKHDEWITDQRIHASEVKGFIEGRATMRKKDLAIVSAIVSGLVMILQGSFVIIERYG